VTTIVAVRTEDRVTLAADTCAQHGGTWIPVKKIWTQQGDRGPLVLLGNAGAAGIGALVRRHLKVDNAPARDDSDDAWDTWAEAISESINGIAVSSEPPQVDEGGLMSGTFLMAAWHRFWIIEGTCDASPIYRYSDFAAIGSGRDAALGALHTSVSASAAVEIAAEVDADTRLWRDTVPTVLTTAR